MKFLSMNICGMTTEKITKLNIKEYDVVFLQEIKNTNNFDVEGYSFYSNPGPYSGTCIFIKKEISHICNILIKGRLQELTINGISYFNNYHKRVPTDRNRIKERILYDEEFLRYFPQKERSVLLGDMNSVFRFHDSAKNLSIAEDLERSKFSWKPGMPIDEKKACYERQFMNYFIEAYDFKDNNPGGFTFYKRDKPCMRIDYCLTNSVGVKKIDLIKSDLSDHVMMIVEF